jgi:hypothetical protein
MGEPNDGPADVLELDDIMDKLFTNEDAITLGKLLMAGGTSDFVEID